MIAEYRRYTTSKQNQEKIGALAWRGIVVSPLGLQSGSRKVADAVNIISVEIDPDCMPQEFSMRFLKKVFVGIHSQAAMSDSYDAEILRKCKTAAITFRSRSVSPYAENSGNSIPIC